MSCLIAYKTLLNENFIEEFLDGFYCARWTIAHKHTTINFDDMNWMWSQFNVVVVVWEIHSTCKRKTKLNEWFFLPLPRTCFKCYSVVRTIRTLCCCLLAVSYFYFSEIHIHLVIKYQYSHSGYPLLKYIPWRRRRVCSCSFYARCMQWSSYVDFEIFCCFAFFSLSLYI